MKPADHVIPDVTQCYGSTREIKLAGLSQADRESRIADTKRLVDSKRAGAAGGEVVVMDKPEWQRRIERARKIDRMIDNTVGAIVAVCAASALGFILWLAIT